ncbi:MAG: M36 family metallopeptidase [Ferruginibacter sp.]
MKRKLLLFFALFYCASAIAQVSKQENDLALNLVRANSKTIGLSENDMNNLVVSSTYQTIADGIRMVYLQQTFKQIPVFNQMQVLAFKNDRLVSVAGARVANIDKISNNSTATISAEDAVDAATRDCKLTGAAALLQVGQNGSKKIYRDISISSEDISAQLVWLPISSKEIKLTWEIGLAPLQSSDLWMIRVDASNGKVLDKNNLTVYEQFPDPVSNVQQLTEAGSFKSSQTNLPNSPLVVNSATYRVVPYPVESPQHTGGTPSLVTDPWTLAPGNATSLKWHYDGTTYHDSTRGNNVWAQEDRDNNDNTFGKTAVSTTAQPTLTFNFTPNFTLAPTTLVNQQLATTNLFYWNNIVHDLSYVYGFDEPSGNFQASNQGRGGLGNDYVIADAQDAGGTNNANFGTPVDGSRPRMQMYLFTSTSPNRDGDLDNGIIVHEYGHGISTRLTGGPANSSCLNNAEEGGEGWSDYFALMATTNWATAQVTDGALAKPMGTYALGQAVTAGGIRQYPYSTNMSINPWTYANMAASGGEVHTIGEIWCTALWEMTWEMIQQDGINPNLFNPAGTGGNSAAMKLVIEGMRLQPCSPGYIDARNAILKADTLFFAAKYSCSIWKAFAKRGMGKGASQGSSNSTTDQVASFVANGGITLLLTQNVTSQQEGLNVTYTNHVSAGVCGGLTNYLLTDTLPSNVTYVSGGTYNSGNRVVSFPVNLTAGSSQDYSFTVQINPGSYFPSVSLINETVAGATIPATWTATSAVGSSAWTTSTTQSHSATRSFFAVDNSAANTDFRLATNTPIALGVIPPVFTFWHYYNTEAGWDGGVVEISTNGGTNWTDLGPNMTTNGYNGSVGGTNPIAGRSAFTGNSGGFIQTKISLLPYANQSALFRFRATSDDNTAATGWYVDDIVMNSLAVVNMRTSLFNNSSTRVAISDTFTIITQSSCVAGTIGTHPANTTVCANATANFSIVATGTSLTYQWQVSTDGGSNYNNIVGQTSPSLSLAGVTVSMNNYRYRCQISGTCTSLTNSNPAILTVNALPVAPSANNAARCGTGAVTISATAGAGETIDWYAGPSGGSVLLSSSTSFTTASISVSTTYYAESRNTTTGCVSATRTAVTATVNANPVAPGAVGAARCGTGTVTISATAGAGETIDWYVASTGGSALLSGSTSFITPSISISTTYYAQARNTTTGCVSATRTAVTATVNATPVAPGAVGAARCGTGTVTISATPGAGETIDWYAGPSGGSALSIGSTSFTTPSISVSTTYYAESRNTTTGCISATRTAVTATVSTNLAAPGANGASRCGTGTVTISATPGAGETIDWYAGPSGGSALLSGSTSFTTASISVNTTYYAESRHITTGCISATRTAVVATVNAIPAAPVGTGAARCGTGTVTISATAGTGETIDWYAGPSGGSAILVASTSFTTPSISVSTTYYAQARNTSVDCISATRTAVVATVNAIPAAPSGTGDFGCGPSILTVSATPGAGETIDWYAGPSGGSALSTGSTFFTTPAISSTTIYYAQARNTTTGCISATRTAVAATIGNNTTSTTHISICATALPYLWNNNSYNAGGTYTVAFTNASGCDSLAKLLLDVGAAINIQTVTGGGSYTNGGVGVPVGLSNSEVGVSYQLLLGGNPIGSPVAGTNAAISFGNQTQQGTYTVFATTALCAQTMLGSATVTIISGPPLQFAVTGGGTYCAGGTGLAVGLAGSQTGVNYQLKRSGGTINVGSTVAGTGTAISFGLQTVASDYSVLATNTVSLATSQMLNSVTIRIASATRAPSAPGAITGSTDACPYMGVSNVTYFIHPASNATSYIWTAPSGANIIGSNTDTIVVIQYPISFVSGTLSVVSVNACFANATSSARTLAITRKVPSTPGTITSSLTNPCSIVGTATTSTYTIRKVTNATGYTWTLPTGITFISNFGDTGVIVKFENGFTTGVISVVAYNNCATSAARTLTVTATAPSAPSAISGPANVCSFIGQPTNATFSITAVTNATSYLWTAPANATIVSGQGTTSVQVSFAATFASGSLTVKSVSGCGSSSARSLSLVKNIAKPGAITPSAPACPSTDVTYTIAAVPFATSYIWSVPTNATYVSGQGTTSFTVTYKPAFVSGTVTVKSVNNCSTSAVSSLAVDASGCTPVSPFAGAKGVIAPAVVKAEETGIYPNPSNGIFKINLNAAGTTGNVTIQLVDMYGKVVLQQKAAVNASGNVSATINAQNVPAGIYEVRYNNGKMMNAQKLVIVK